MKFDTKTICYCVVALLLGMLLANMLKNICGCKDLVEGLDENSSCYRWLNDDANLDEQGNKPCGNGIKINEDGGDCIWPGDLDNTGINLCDNNHCCSDTFCQSLTDNSDQGRGWKNSHTEIAQRLNIDLNDSAWNQGISCSMKERIEEESECDINYGPNSEPWRYKCNNPQNDCSGLTACQLRDEENLCKYQQGGTGKRTYEDDPTLIMDPIFESCASRDISLVFKQNQINECEIQKDICSIWNGDQKPGGTFQEPSGPDDNINTARNVMIKKANNYARGCYEDSQSCETFKLNKDGGGDCKCSTEELNILNAKCVHPYNNFCT